MRLLALMVLLASCSAHGEERDYTPSERPQP